MVPPSTTPSSLAAADLETFASPAGSSLIRRRLELERPSSEPCSGLFPAVDMVPIPVGRRGIRLRRAVLLTVIIGAMGLLAYGASLRAGHAQAPDHAALTSPR
ncbi:MAG: hypothetical protein AB1Z98_39955 [Nannocystaceae bacterium]